MFSFLPISTYYLYWITVLAGIYILIKIYNIKFTGMYKGNDRLDGKTVIVTGATSGIGRVCAKDFASRGAKVIMACRDARRAEIVKQEIVRETKNDKIKVKRVDFSSLESVRDCAKEILNEEDKIHILLNNAGAFNIGFTQTNDGLDVLMQSNHFGPFLFTNLLLGLIKESAPSRIVNVSSLGYKFAKIDLASLKTPKCDSPGVTDYIKLYSDTKLCNVYFTTELAQKLEGTGVTVNCLHPGVFPSELNKKPTFFSSIMQKILPVFFKSTEEGAQTSIFLCVSPSVSGVTGKYFADCKENKLQDIAADMGIAKRVWEISEDAVKLQSYEKHF